jgi:hypothetical protein
MITEISVHHEFLKGDKEFGCLPFGRESNTFESFFGFVLRIDEAEAVHKELFESLPVHQIAVYIVDFAVEVGLK